MTPRLKEYYEKKIINDLQKEFSLKNKLMVPKIEKVILNMGLGKMLVIKKYFKTALKICL